MKKKFNLSIDIDADIIEQITPKLIEKRIDEDYDGDIQIPLDALEKLQVVLSYILKNDNHFLDILVGHLLENQTNLGDESELGKYFHPKIFEAIALKIGKEMAPDYESFIIDLANYRVSAAAKNFFKIEKKTPAEDKGIEQLFDSMKKHYNDLLIPIDGKAPELELEEEISESEMISEFLMLLLNDCLLNYKITGASLKEIKNGS
jgi:hypothetical protein